MPHLSTKKMGQVIRLIDAVPMAEIARLTAKLVVHFYQTKSTADPPRSGRLQVMTQENDCHLHGCMWRAGIWIFQKTANSEQQILVHLIHQILGAPHKFLAVEIWMHLRISCLVQFFIVTPLSMHAFGYHFKLRDHGTRSR